MSKPLAGFAAAAVALGLAAPASAAMINYSADLVSLNPTGAHGTASLTYDTSADTLAVSVEAMNLTPNMVHAQHIHGIVNGDGSAGDSITPSIASDDMDGDGYVELLEAFPSYGFILVPLTLENGMFPTADADGKLSYSRLFNLSDDIYDGDFGREDLFPLTFREIVIHGVIDPEDAGEGVTGTGALGLPTNEIDAVQNGYEPLAPTAAGAINQVPVPAAAWLLGTGLAGLAFGARRRKRS